MPELENFGLTDPDFIRLVAGRVRSGEIARLPQALLAKYAKRLRAIADQMTAPPIEARELTRAQVASLPSTGDVVRADSP